MSIDQFTDKKDINIKDMVIEASHIKKPEKWHVEVTPEEWREISEDMNTDLTYKSWYRYFEKAGPISILKPDGKSREFPDREENYINIVTSLKERHLSDVLGFGLLEFNLAAQVKLLFPEKDVAWDGQIMPEEFLDEMERRYMDLDMAEGAISFFILFPKKLDMLRQKRIGDKLIENTEGLGQMKRLISFTALKLVFLELYREPPDTFFTEMQSAIEMRKNGNDFLKYASYLKLLAAEKVQMIDQGLVVEMPNSIDINAENQTVPERRRF